MPIRFFKRKDKKESNIASTPEPDEKQKKRLTRIDIFFLVWNILSMALYTSYTLFVVYELAEKTFLSKVIIYLLVAYCVVFVLLIILSIRNRRKLKHRLKNFKSATKFLKYLIKIINFALSIVTAISAFVTTGTTDVSAIIYGILSLIITIILVIVEIVSIIIRKNIPVIKRNLLTMREKREPKSEVDDE